MERTLLQDKLSELLEFKRIEHGFSCHDMASFLGVSYLQYHRWVTKKTLPRRKTLQEICEKCSIDYLSFINTTTNCLTPVTFDSVCSLYSRSDLDETTYKTFLVSVALMFGELQDKHGCVPSVVISNIAAPDVQALSRFEIQALFHCADLGTITVIGGVKNLMFKASQVDTPNGGYGFEVLSSASLGRFIELSKLKHNL